MILESVIIIWIIFDLLTILCVLTFNIILEILIERRNDQGEPAKYSKDLQK